jgi:ribosomal protein S18 acetylase RimI-like enzyme
MLLTADKIFCRWMGPKDEGRILEIENDSSPQPQGVDLLAYLKKRNYFGVVCEVNSKIVAFMIYHVRKENIEIESFCVDPNYRLQGIGKKMMDEVKTKLNSRRRKLDLFVPDSSLDAHLFLKRMGFIADGIIRRCYGQDDGYYFIFTKET